MNKFTITAVTLINGATIRVGDTPRSGKVESIEIVDGAACVAISSGIVYGYNNWVDYTGSLDQPTPTAPMPASKRR